MTPLTPSMFEILAALGAGPLHGYAIAKRIVDLHQGATRPIGPATLYSSLQRLEEMGFIEEVEALPGDSRRKTYRMTSSGATHLSQAIVRQRQFLDSATSSAPDGILAGGAK